MKQHVENWLKRVMLLIENAQKIKKLQENN
jgi:hypothetical protein